MVEIANGFKMGTVKFIGDTEFAPGEWIGVALERANGVPEPVCTTCVAYCVCCRQTHWNSEGSQVLQVQGQAWSVCAQRQDHPRAVVQSSSNGQQVP